MKIFEIKNILRRNLFLVSLRLRSRGEYPKNYIVQKGITDICIDGYPRSANSFSVRMFLQANPNINIAHHTHSVANLKKAIKYNIPTVVLIRDPEQSIVSSVIAHKKNDIDEEVSRYIDFYGWVCTRLDRMIVADFDQVINDFNAVILEINNQCDKSFLLLENVKEADSQVKDDIEKRYDRLGQSEMSHIKPVPTNERNKIKEKFREAVLNHSDFQEAKKLYENIMFHTNGQFDGD